MALKIDYTKKQAGIDVLYPDAYIRLKEVLINNKYNMDVEFIVYNNVETVDTGDCFIIDKINDNIPFNIETPVHLQAYVWLKNQAGFENVEDY